MSLASSSALVVNTFAPFKSFIPIELLEINSYSGFQKITFEKEFENGLTGTSPQLDVYLEGNGNYIAIESKFLEPLKRRSKKKNNLSKKYREIKDSRKDTKWYDILLDPDAHLDEYEHLDAIQLLKHLFGIHHDNQGTNVELLYLYWKPENYDQFPELEIHEDEINRFSKQLTDTGVRFSYYTHQELWYTWEKSGDEKLSRLGRMLREKYDI